VDPRITNSDGASFDSHSGTRVFANSRGFLGSYRSTSCSLSTVPVAKSGDRMERDYWYSIGRDYTKLESPEEIGRLAAERVLRRLGARKIPTQQATIVFEPRVARSLVGHVFAAVTGDAIYRKSSFLLDKIGQAVAHPSVTIVDDPTMPGLFGSSPFDDEGVPGRRHLIIENGVLKTYLLHTYTARKLGLKTTGNASRGLTGSPGTGHGNLFLEAGTMTPEEILKAVGTGLFVTELIGQGVNTVNGDYSRGASGLWIENGELTYPVAEITVAGNLSEMLKNILYIGNDLEFRGSTSAPTVAIGGMTISGAQ
jgi:PmbA protein